MHAQGIYSMPTIWLFLRCSGLSTQIQSLNVGNLENVAARVSNNSIETIREQEKQIHHKDWTLFLGYKNQIFLHVYHFSFTTHSKVVWFLFGFMNFVSLAKKN
jgi:type II secretory pathway component PulJ